MACVGSLRVGRDQGRLAPVTHIADAWTPCYASFPSSNSLHGIPHFDGNTMIYAFEHLLRFNA